MANLGQLRAQLLGARTTLRELARYNGTPRGAEAVGRARNALEDVQRQLGQAIPALAYLQQDASARLLERIYAALADGTGEFRPDPQVAGVEGFFVDDQVRVIVYLRDRDFEVCDEWS